MRYRSATLAAFERNPITSRSMARRLPQLVRRALVLAWQVDRRAVVGLMLCQVLSGVFEAFGLLATTGTITALISSGHMAERVREALPSLAVLAGAAGLRALLGIAVSNISTRLAPRISREAEMRMLDSAINAELAAYD
ncbi:ABC transporter, partial [Streptomyces sp. MCAF7]